jgi:hypothetical protein
MEEDQLNLKVDKLLRNQRRLKDFQSIEKVKLVRISSASSAATKPKDLVASPPTRI